MSPTRRSPSPRWFGSSRRGTLFVRDLRRPEDAESIAALVEAYAADESDSARELFAASLGAALTLEEMREFVAARGLWAEGVAKSSDRHWTWTCRRPSDAT